MCGDNPNRSRIHCVQKGVMKMVKAVQMKVGETQGFSSGNSAAMIPLTVRLQAGTTLIINFGVNDTVYVKSGTRRVNGVRIVQPKPGQTVLVTAIR